MQPEGRPKADFDRLCFQQQRPSRYKNQLRDNVDSHRPGENPQIQSQQNIDHFAEIFPSESQI
jgi:uncharacterized protein YbgA (DUF1722 family)